MKHRIKIGDMTWYKPSIEILQVVFWAEKNIGPIKLRTESGYVRFEGDEWRIVKPFGDGWFLETDNEQHLVLVALIL